MDSPENNMPMKNNNMAIVGLILGIFSLLGCWIPIWNLILSIGGIVFENPYRRIWCLNIQPC